MHCLRTEVFFSKIVEDLILVPEKADTRDVKAIRKIATGFLKLFFPHVKTASDITPEDFDFFCLQRAKKMRSVIRKQIFLLDEEFEPEIPDIRIKTQ